MAYSEFNHHVAGWLLLIIALAELSQAIRPSRSIGWARFLLPTALGSTGIFLLIWSDHEAWPIGSMSLFDTLFGGDPEIAQHKLYGMLALAIASVETLRRLRMVRHAGWMVPLPAFAIVGGWMLFGHSHGIHPSAHKIAMHHAVMGTLAITAGSSKLVGAWRQGHGLGTLSRWEALWSFLILLIAIQLVCYTES
jgi:putative copper resistance protein D